MCGLYGAYGWIGSDEKRGIKALQMFSQLRGRDSSGIAVVPNVKSAKVTVLKTVGGQESLIREGEKLFDQGTWDLKPINIQCVIGHCRHATVGIVNDENAHPFEYGDIVGCHNGTVYKSNLSHLESHAHDLIDSQILIKELSREDTTPAEVLEYVHGAWALTWWDKKEDNLHMCRNSRRDLFVVKTEDGRTLFWASEIWMLHAMAAHALARNIDMKLGKVMFVQADRHLIWEKDKGGKVILKVSEDAKGGKVNQFFRPTPARESSSFRFSVTYKGPKSKTTKRHDKKTGTNVVPINKGKGERSHVDEFEETYTRTYDGLYVTKREYEKLVEGGCSWQCGEELTWEDRDEITWYWDDCPVCADCEGSIKTMDKDRKVN